MPESAEPFTSGPCLTDAIDPIPLGPAAASPQRYEAEGRPSHSPRRCRFASGTLTTWPQASPPPVDLSSRAAFTTRRGA